MLYQIGTVQLSTFPLPIDAVERESAADFAAHDLLGRLRSREFVGEGDETITLRGRILPFVPELDGREDLEALQGCRLAGEPLAVMRGDGRPLGWFVIEAIRESHSQIQARGVAAVIDVEIRMTKVGQPGPDTSASLLGSLISLFNRV